MAASKNLNKCKGTYVVKQVKKEVFSYDNV